ncbi:MAG: hypothetical protein J6A50_06805 [Clostridia bacterium]|nr:hypothetical protein [Clostridia bacterium]
MTELFNKIFQFGFHDTEITYIEKNEDGFELLFDKGLYYLDGNGKETQLTKPIKMIVKIKAVAFLPVENMVEITDFSAGQKDIVYHDFEEMVKKHSFQLFMVYYSAFASRILFDGGIGNKHIQFVIEGCCDVCFLKNQT